MTGIPLSSKFITVSLFIVSHTFLVAQGWQKIPINPPGPNEVNLKGITTVAKVVKAGNLSDARIVISGAGQSKIYSLGIWIDGLSSFMPEKELWPYIGPDLGQEAMNPNMIEITLSRGNYRFKWNFRMLMASGGNFPKGDWKDKDLLFSTTISPESRNYNLLKTMNAGFDNASITIGRGVFRNHIELTFKCNNFSNAFTDVKHFVD